VHEIKHDGYRLMVRRTATQRFADESKKYFSGQVVVAKELTSILLRVAVWRGRRENNRMR
jgi:hypothetical protein